MNIPGGKGSGPRPFGVDKATYGDNWDRIFGKKEDQSSQDQNAPKKYYT